VIDLEHRWHSFARKIILPQPDAIWDSIVTLYSEKDRHYHNLQHIADCLHKLDQWPGYVPEKNAIELALWFHDIIYETQRADSKESCAALATHFLRGHPLETNISSLILATQHRATKGMKPEEIICDIDLSILGSQPKKYQLYAQNTRLEYLWLGSDEYRIARTNVIENILAREHIFQTNYAHHRWEKQARSNLQKERNALQIEACRI